jgi:hypothetical protein
MPQLEHDIKPGRGLGDLLLGSPEHAVREILGEPTTQTDSDYGDGQITRDWEYYDLGVSLSFNEDEDLRLGLITTENAGASLHGLAIIGLSEQELLSADFGGLGPPVLDDDFGESGKDYLWDSANLSCWVSDGVVVSVSIMPLYDATGDIPLWPEEVG